MHDKIIELKGEKMKTVIFLIRHGETKWNSLGKFQGCKDIDLADNGLVQANYLKERLESKFDFIYTSPLKRAFETARILASESKKKLLIENDLREINFGEWEGMTVTQIKTSYPEAFETWKTDKFEAPLCGGDKSIKLASVRAANCILKIAKKHNGNRVAIIAHGGILKAGLIGILGWDMTMYHKIVLGNTAISQVNFDEEFNPCLISLNDTNHLSQDSRSVSFV